MERITAFGVDVAVETAGTGRPLVLLHGILADHRSWDPQSALADDFRLVAWDAPGCGRSDDPVPTWRFGDYADCLAEVIERLGLADPIVGGLSWGASLAIAFQERHPGIAAGLVLAGGYAGWAGSLPADEREQRLASCLTQSTWDPADVVSAWMPGLVAAGAPPAVVDECSSVMADFHPSGFRTMARAVAEADLRPALRAADMPTLLLYGEQDLRSPPDTVGEALHAALPDSRLVRIPGAGHLCNAEQPAAFDDAVRTFTASL